MKKTHGFFVLLIIAAFVLRFYPTLLTGLPYSTDGWSLIRNTELLVANSPVPLNDDTIFDGYNNYWPASSIFGAVLSEVLGIAPIDTMALSAPFAGVLSVGLFFVLVRKITENTQVSLVASALLATAFPTVLLTAGVTKETFATPLYLSLLLLFLFKPTWQRTALFVLFSSVLVLSHHLTTFAALAVLVCFAAALFLTKMKNEVFLKSSFSLIALFSLITLVYFGVFAYGGLNVYFASSDLLSVFVYQILVFSIALYFASKRTDLSRRRTLILCSIAAALAFTLTLLCTQKSVLPSALILPPRYLIYMLPFILSIPIAMYGFRDKDNKRRISALLALFWLVPFVGLTCYSIFANSPFGLTLVYRALNFLLIPLFLLVAIGFWRLTDKEFRWKRSFKLGLGGALAIFLFLNCFVVFASVSLRDPYLGYFWLYHEPEMDASEWVASYASNVSVAGDVKVSYLLDYFDVPVDVFGGLRYLESDGSPPSLMVIYSEMETNGYVVYGGYPLALSGNWTNKLDDLNCVYSNGMVNVYAK